MGRTHDIDIEDPGVPDFVGDALLQPGSQLVFGSPFVATLQNSLAVSFTSCDSRVVGQNWGR